MVNVAWLLNQMITYSGLFVYKQGVVGHVRPGVGYKRAIVTLIM